MLKNSLTAGVARIDITPPLGFRMAGAMRRTEGATGIESPLLATALVLADDLLKIVIISCDLIGLDPPLANEIRDQIGKRLSISSSNVVLGCTHTHNGPCTSRGNIGGVHDIGGEAWEIEALDVYIGDLVSQLVDLATTADQERQPARASGGEGTARVSINREEIDSKGKTFVGQNPDGLTDHSVPVLRVDDLEGGPIAVITGYACHPVSMGYETYEFTPDFPGVVRRVVERVTGATCLYLTGAAGNQASLSFLQSDWGEMERMGGQIGAAAVQEFYRIDTRPHKIIREEGKSLSDVAHYTKEFSTGSTHQNFSIETRQVTVPLQQLPDLETAADQFNQVQKRVVELTEQGAPKSVIYPQMLVERWAKGVLEKVEAGITEENLTFEIQGIRLDDFVLLTMPGEPFVEIGLEAKENSRAKVTMFAGYCNGIVAYWPSPKTINVGGMAVESAVKTYNNSAPPVSNAVEIIVQKFANVSDGLRR